MARSTRVLRAWTAWTARASDEIPTTFRILRLPPAPEVPEPLRGIATVCVNGVALDSPTMAGRYLTPSGYGAVSCPRAAGDQLLPAVI